MILHLYLDYTAEIERDGSLVLSIDKGGEIEAGGRLDIAGESLQMKHGDADPRVPDKAGVFSGVFTTNEGIRYVLRAVKIRSDGSLSSEVDFTGKYFALQKHVDKLARAVEKLSYEVCQMKGQIIPDALGFMGVGEKEEE